MAGGSTPSGPSSREALIDAATMLARESPGRALGAREIARRAGVNHSLLFRHFGSVDALLDEIASSSLKDLAEAVAHEDDPASGVAVLVAGVSAHSAALTAQMARSLASGEPAPAVGVLVPALAEVLARTGASGRAEADKISATVVTATLGIVVLGARHVSVDDPELAQKLISMSRTVDESSSTPSSS